MLARRLLMAAGIGAGSFIAPPPLAYETLTRYGTVPVLTRGGVGAWDHDTVAGEQVFRDTRLECWVMVYGGLDKPIADGGIGKIGLAYSDDLLTWTKEATNPVYTPPVGDVMSATANVVQVSANSYRLYSQVYPASDAFALATSTDMLGWTDQGHVLHPGTAGQFDDKYIFDPNPIIFPGDGVTYLWYGGWKNSDNSRKIGIASAADGVNFTHHGSRVGPYAGEASASFGAPAVIVTDATHHSIWHDTSDVATDTTRYIDLRETSDGGLSFSHVHRFLEANPAGWDSVQVFDAAPVIHHGVLFLFYAGSAFVGGVTDLSPDIGLATMAWPP